MAGSGEDRHRIVRIVGTAWVSLRLGEDRSFDALTHRYALDPCLFLGANGPAGRGAGLDVLLSVEGKW